MASADATLREARAKLQLRQLLAEKEKRRAGAADPYLRPSSPARSYTAAEVKAMVEQALEEAARAVFAKLS